MEIDGHADLLLELHVALVGQLRQARAQLVGAELQAEHRGRLAGRAAARLAHLDDDGVVDALLRQVIGRAAADHPGADDHDVCGYCIASSSQLIAAFPLVRRMTAERRGAQSRMQ